MALSTNQYIYKGFGVYRVAPELYTKHYYSIVAENRFSRDFLDLFDIAIRRRNKGYFLSRKSAKEFIDKLYEEYNKIKQKEKAV